MNCVEGNEGGEEDKGAVATTTVVAVSEVAAIVMRRVRELESEVV